MDARGRGSLIEGFEVDGWLGSGVGVGVVIAWDGM